MLGCLTNKTKLDDNANTGTEQDSKHRSKKKNARLIGGLSLKIRNTCLIELEV